MMIKVRERKNLSDYIPHKGFYPAGRLDYHSEGLILLTDNGALQNRVTSPITKWKNHILFRQKELQIGKKYRY